MFHDCLQLNWGPTLTLGETEKIWEGQEGKSNHGTARWQLGCSLCSAFLKRLESIKQRLGSYFGWDWQNLRRQRLWRQSWHCKLVTGLMCSALPADFLDNVSAGTSNGKNTLRLKSQKWGKNSQKVIKELNRKNWLTKNDWNSKWAIWQGRIWQTFWRIKFGLKKAFKKNKTSLLIADKDLK